MTPGSTISVEQYTTQPMLWSGLIEAAITPPGSTLSRPVSPAAPAGCAGTGSTHQGMPFWAQMAAAPGASRRPSCGAIAGRLYAFSATKTRRRPRPRQCRRSPPGGRRSHRAATDPHAALGHRRRCAPLAISVTSAPPRARAARHTRRSPRRQALRTSCAGPALRDELPDPAPLNLARRRARDLLDMSIWAGTLKAASCRRQCSIRSPGSASARSVSRRSDELSVLGVGTPKADGIADRRMRGKHLLDLRRGDVLATADDHLLDPSFE